MAVKAEELESVPEPDMDEVGRRVGEVITASLLKGQALADRLDVSESTITRWKQGKGLGLPVVARIANRLAGEGWLSLSAYEIRAFLWLDTDAPPIRHDRPRPVGARVESAAPGSTKGRSLSARAHSRYLKAA